MPSSPLEPSIERVLQIVHHAWHLGHDASLCGRPGLGFGTLRQIILQAVGNLAEDVVALQAPVVGWSDYVRDALLRLGTAFRSLGYFLEREQLANPEHPLIVAFFFPERRARTDCPEKTLLNPASDRLFSLFHSPLVTDGFRALSKHLEGQVISDLTFGHAERPDASSKGDTLEHRAVAAWFLMSKEGGTPSVADLAEELGCRRTSLYRYQHLMTLVRGRGRQGQPPRGTRDARKGRMEAEMSPRGDV